MNARRAALRLIAVLATAAAVAAGIPVLAADTGSAGVVVVDLSPNGATASAGIEAGDRLIAWSYDGGAQQPIRTPFDVVELERELQPIRSARLHGIRDGAGFSAAIGPGKWWTTTRPDWDPATQQAFAALRENLDRNDPQPTIDAARSLYDAIEATGNRINAAWVIADTAAAIGRSGHWDRAGELYRFTVDALAGSTHATAQAWLAYEHGVALMRQSRFDESEIAFREALLLHRAIDPMRLGVAASQIGIGRVAERKSDFETARTNLEEGLWLQEKLAPGSLLVASTLNELGRSAASRANMPEAEAYFQRALDIAEEVLPGGSEVAGYLNSLAIAAYLQGDIAGAEQHWARSLAIKEVYEPDSANVAAVLGNIGLVKLKRGDYQQAERIYERVLDIQQRRSPQSAESMRTLNNLGVIAMEQGDLAAAERYHRRTYEIRKAAAPDSLDFAASLLNLGNVARHRGDFDAADDFYRQALAIQTRHAPADRRQGNILLNLGEIALRRGDLDVARDRLHEGLDVFRNIAPAGPGAGEALLRVGEFLFRHESPDAAAGMYREALAIFEVIAPQSYPEAEALHGLARVHWRNAEHDEARAAFERAVDAIDSQHARLGGSEETRATVRAKYVAVYRDFMDFLLERGDDEHAFEILERSRSKILSDLLAERDLVFSVDLPADVERRRRMLAYNYESLQAKLYETADAGQISDLRASMAEIRQQQVALRRDIRSHAPRLADLQYPSPVTVAEARAQLAPGTAAVSYSVSATRTVAFVLKPDGELRVHRLPIDATGINDRVTRFRLLMDAGRWDTEPGDGLVALARSLYRDLLAPLEADLEQADRLLLVPDEALNVLPFAALIRDADGDEPQYLAEWKPSLVVNSLTVYSQLAPRTEQPAAGTLVAFGSPSVVGAVAVDETATRSAEPRTPLTALPWSRMEVENIGELYAERATIYTGDDATEDRAKRATRDQRYVHFATHAVLNESLPLDSSIVLAGSGADGQAVADNGLLQVWEIYESLRLDAELVTLSGCETALGTHFAGEGLVGMTRAFQYAGSTSVLASLWSVNDRSTSELMTSFYAMLAEGLPMEEALREAQVQMIRGSAKRNWFETLRSWLPGDDARTNGHPYHWAGFVLHGTGG